MENDLKMHRFDRDLIVSLNIVSPLALTSRGENGRDFQASVWKSVIPKDNPFIAATRPWMVVHTADQSSRGWEHAHRPGGERATHPGNRRAVHQERSTFCGWDEPLAFLHLELSPEYLQRAAAEMGKAGLALPQVAHTRDPRIVQAGEWLLEELGRGRTTGNLYVDSLVNVLVMQILHRSRTPTDPSARYGPPPLASQDISAAIEYMRSHLGQEIRLGDLAALVHLSPSQLGRLFKRATHLTPHQYLILLRVNHARELLVSGKLPASEVARQSGFVDQSHLNRHLKRIYGVTPKNITAG